MTDTLTPPQTFRKTSGIHRVGLAADRPAASSVLIGTLYFSSDVNLLERSTGATWQAYAAPSVAGSPLFSFDFSSATTAPPTSNQLRFDAGAPYTQVTHVWVRTITNEGRDIFWGLMLVAVGSLLTVQDKNDHTIYAQFTVTTAPVDQTGYVEFGVVWRASGGAFLNNQAVLLQNSAGTTVPAHHTTHEPGGTDVLQTSAPNVLLGRGDSVAGPIQTITLSPSLIMTDTQLSVRTGIVNYTYNSTLTAPPAAGQCRLNAAFPWTAATKLWLRFLSADGQDLFWAIMLLPIGAVLLLQDKDDHTRYGQFTITATPTDQGLYAEIAVNWRANGTAILTAQQVFLRVAGSF